MSALSRSTPDRCESRGTWSRSRWRWHSSPTRVTPGLRSRIGLSGSGNSDVHMENVMSKRVWLITGAGRGMGADFAKAALAAGHAVVATGRNSDAVSTALGKSNDLLSVTLDVTKLADAEAAARAAVDRFGRIDVLVNNAASF